MLETTFVCSANKFSALDKKIASLHLCYSHSFLAFGSSLYEENRERIIITQGRLRQVAGKSDAVNNVKFLYICRALSLG